MRGPRQLDQASINQREPFAKQVIGEADFLEHFAGWEFQPTQFRFAVHSRALIKPAVSPKQPLCERSRVVRIAVDYFIGHLPRTPVARGGSGWTRSPTRCNVGA